MKKKRKKRKKKRKMRKKRSNHVKSFISNKKIYGNIILQFFFLKFL